MESMILLAFSDNPPHMRCGQGQTRKRICPARTCEARSQQVCVQLELYRSAGRSERTDLTSPYLALSLDRASRSLAVLPASARAFFALSGEGATCEGSKPGRPAAATFHKYGHVDGSEAKDNQPCASERHGRAVDAVQIGIHRG